MEEIAISVGGWSAGLFGLATMFLHPKIDASGSTRLGYFTALLFMTGWLVGFGSTSLIQSLLEVSGAAGIAQIPNLAMLVAALAAGGTVLWRYFNYAKCKLDATRANEAFRFDGVLVASFAILALATGLGLRSTAIGVISLVALVIVDDWAIISKYKVVYDTHDQVHALRLFAAGTALLITSAYSIYWLKFAANGPDVSTGLTLLLAMALYVTFGTPASFEDGEGKMSTVGRRGWTIATMAAFVLFSSTFLSQLGGLSASGEVKSWPTVDAVVEFKDCQRVVEEHDHSFWSITYVPNVRFSYVVEGVKLTSNKFSFAGQHYSDHTDCMHALEMAERASTAWYAPDNMRTAVLSPRAPSGLANWASIIFGLLVSFCGMAGALFVPIANLKRAAD